MKKCFVLFCFCLWGCNVGPKYKAPEVTLSDAWNISDSDEDLFVSTEISTRWWELFGDEKLNQYIEKAADCNHSVKIAEANILQARAVKTIATSQLFPQLLADFDGSKTYFSKNGPVLAGPSLAQGVSGITGLPFQLQIPQIQSLYNALIDVSWEIDIFGKVRKEIAMAEAIIGSSEEERNKLLLSIFSEIAINYMQLRGSQQIGKILEQDIELLEQNLQIEEDREKEGYSKTQDVIEVEAQLATARSRLPAFYAQIYQCIYAISVLTGDLPEKLLEDLLPIDDLPSPPCQVSLGLRSDLVRRRPDVNQAERMLAAATANVGIAVASFFPVFTLSADVGFQSLKFINLFRNKSKTYSFGGDINMPIFQGGRLVGNLRLAEAGSVAAAESYQQTVLNALQETQTYIAKYQNDLKTYEQLCVAKEKEKLFFGITKQQFNEGYIDQTVCIQNERKLNDSFEKQVKSKQDLLLDLIILYKSLGGGFEPFPDKKQK